MGIYKIRSTSWALWITTLLATFFIGILLVIKFLAKDGTVAIIVITLLMICAIYLQRFISRAEVEIKLTGNDISIEWIRQYIFHSRPNRLIPFNEIDSYKYQPDNNFDLFKLTLKDGTEIKLWHFTFTSNDDFEKLVSDFSQAAIKYNKKIRGKNELKENEEEKTGIKRAKTIFESAYAPLLAGFAIFMMIAVPIILYVNPPGKSKNPFVLLAPLGGAIFFLIQYFKYRKSKNQRPA